VDADGVNIPDYPRLAQLWWQNIGDASSGAKTPQAGDGRAGGGAGLVLERLQRANVQGECGPRLNPRTSAEEWFARAERDGNIAPQRRLANEKPQGETVDYDTLIRSWPATPPRRS
jgi:glycerol transport system substrate-binding protein